MSDVVEYSASRADMLQFVPAHASAVLDVGCASGGFGRSLLDTRPDVRVWGVEPDQAAAGQAAHAGYAGVAVGRFPDAASELDARQFDAIFFNDVLEHMPEPASAVAAAHDLVAPRGVVIASIPNVRHFSVIWPLVRHGDWRYEASGIMDRTHLRFFTPRTMRELFEENGWQVVRLTGMNRTRWPLGGVDTWKTRLLGRMTFGRSDPFFFTQYVVEAISLRSR